VRSRGFVLPAAGKTGTSHDGWFAGFTTRLICVVWVGFDDNRELRLEGAHSALPIWTEFMKRAHEYREYRGARPFDAPDGIVSVEVDAVTGKLATSGCPSTRSEVFVAGTQPVEYCRLHGGGATRVAGWETPGETADGAAPAAERPRRSARLTTPEPPAASAPPPPAAPQKRGFFGRIRELFK
jgi:penicillin-binding protein 1B